MKVLIAYDGTPGSRAAIATAGALFAPAEAIVLTVREPELQALRRARARSRSPEDVIRTGLAEIERRVAGHAQAAIGEGVELATAAGLDARGEIAAGTRPWRAIERAAAVHAVDLVACGSHGHPPIGRAFLGSTASSLLHHAACPVLVTPAGFGPPPETVIIGYDGSKSAALALDFAAEHLHGHRAVVTCVWSSPVRHSVDVALLSCLPSDAVHDFVADFDDACERHARDTAERGAGAAETLGMAAEARTIESRSTPWRALLRVAADQHSTLIVTGAEREATSALGSVSSGLVHHAAAAILVVPRLAPQDGAVKLTGGRRQYASEPR